MGHVAGVRRARPAGRRVMVDPGIRVAHPGRGLHFDFMPDRDPVLRPGAAMLTSDAGIGSPAMDELCEKDGHTCTFGLGTSSRLKGWAHPLLRRAEKRYGETGEPSRLFAFRRSRAKTGGAP